MHVNQCLAKVSDVQLGTVLLSCVGVTRGNFSSANLLPSKLEHIPGKWVILAKIRPWSIVSQGIGTVPKHLDFVEHPGHKGASERTCKNSGNGTKPVGVSQCQGSFSGCISSMPCH